eukprot:4437290-Pyramimonas_sp.AAC.1
MQRLLALLEASGPGYKGALSWVKNEWAPCLHLWCPAYWSHIFTRGFRTNNYTESLNSALKSLLLLRADLRVDSLWRVVIEEFTPRYVHKHLEANLRDSDDTIRLTGKKFPPEFGKRPLNVMKLLLLRQKRSELIPTKDITRDSTQQGVFQFVKSRKTMLSEFRFGRGSGIMSPTTPTKTAPDFVREVTRYFVLRFPNGDISGHDGQGKKRTRESEQDEDQTLTNTSCTPEQGQSDEEAKEEQLADELQDIEDELRDADEDLHAGLEQDVSDALNGEVSNLKEDDEGVVEEELNMEQGEKKLFEEWVKQCRE